MDPEQYPKTDVGDHQEEQIIRDFNMFNYHINSHKMRWLKDVIDIIDAHRYMFDFCEGLDAGILWDVTETNAVSYSCTDEVNGVLLLQNGGAQDDRIEISRLCECWKLNACYPLYTEMRFKIDNPVLAEFWFGLIQTHSYFTAPNNFFVFENDGFADANLEISARLAGGIAVDTLTGHVLSNDTWLRLGLHWDGAGNMRWFVIQDGDPPQTILFTGIITANIPTTELTIGFGINNGTAAARNMKIDYLKICQKRVIE